MKCRKPHCGREAESDSEYCSFHQDEEDGDSPSIIDATQAIITGGDFINLDGNPFTEF